MAEHKLSEEEINAIVDKVCDKLATKFYLNIGSGLFGMIWRGLILILLGIAAYGALGTFHIGK